MDIEEIEIMARCAGLMKYITPPGTREWHGTIDDLAKLVNGVIRNERDACAQAVEECGRNTKNGEWHGNNHAAAAFAECIRMRSNSLLDGSHAN